MSTIGPKTAAARQNFLQTAKSTAKDIVNSDGNPAASKNEVGALKGAMAEVLSKKALSPELRGEAVFEMAKALPTDQQNEVMNNFVSEQLNAGNLTRNADGQIEASGRSTVVSSVGDKDASNAEFIKQVQSQIFKFRP